MTSNFPDVSERLRLALGTWQNLAMYHEYQLAGMAAQIQVDDAHKKASRAWSLFEDKVLDNAVSEFHTEEVLPTHPCESAKIVHSAYQWFPAELFKWNRCSRRVFHLPHALEAVLASASFPQMRWSDVVWPFDSFIVTLEKPIRFEQMDGGHDEFDMLMISRKAIRGQPWITIRLFTTPEKSVGSVAAKPGEVKRFRQLLRKGRYEQAFKIVRRRQKEILRISPQMYGTQTTTLLVDSEGEDEIRIEPEDIYTIHSDEGKSDFESLPPYARSQMESVSVALRIAVGLSLYLETISSDSARWEERGVKGRKGSGAGALGVIVDPERICNIVGKGRISPHSTTDEQTRRNSAGFVRPHWRRAHRRRPVGSSLTAEKTIRVPPKLVREDLVPLYGIVGGTKTLVMVK